MKSTNRRAIQASAAAQAKRLSEDAREEAFRQHRTAEKAANAEKTARLKGLRLQKEAAERAAKKGLAPS